jgi:hypothetical protein
MKAKETPSFTKPFGSLGEERKETFYKKKDCCRTHPRTNEGYSNVGSGDKTDARTAGKGIQTADRNHPFQETGTGQGYKNVGKGDKSDARKR